VYESDRRQMIDHATEKRGYRRNRLHWSNSAS